MDSKGRSLYGQAGTSVDMTRSLEEDSMVDGPLISADALHSAIRREFQTVPTHCHAGLLCLLHVVYVVLSVCVAVLCMLKLGQVEVCMSVLGNVSGDSVIVFGKVCLWVLVLVFTQCVQHHHSRARRRGYLQFYRETQGLNHLPLTVHSAGNVLLLVVLAAELSPTVHTYLLLSILGLELLVAVPCLLYYTGLASLRIPETATATPRVASDCAALMVISGGMQLHRLDDEGTNLRRRYVQRASQARCQRRRRMVATRLSLTEICPDTPNEGITQRQEPLPLLQCRKEPADAHQSNRRATIDNHHRTA
ncbi:transmembrane protein 192 isoform X1 [Lates japonicus]|uniref:Transmembrane protein 192 n=1 Tax=Lates japonicus TaxID=270547 RepID=A0AAD3NL11_LATJO|nr:transmembrane protein 192 isoform X1 [Lates japonicus]